MNQDVCYSFDPLATKDDHRNAQSRSVNGAAPVVGKIPGSTSAPSGGPSINNYDSNGRSRNTAVGNGDNNKVTAASKNHFDFKHRTTDNVSFSNISHLTFGDNSDDFSEKEDCVSIHVRNGIENLENDGEDENLDKDTEDTVDSEITRPRATVKVVVESSETKHSDFPSAPKRTSASSLHSSSTATGGTFASSVSTLPTLDLNQNLPPLTRTVTYGFGVKMVASSSSQQLIYRSVPPRPLSYTLTDVLDSAGPQRSKLRSKTAPVSSDTPEEYAQRFKSRPTTRPKVIEFDGSTVSGKIHRSVATVGFPTARAKLYIGPPKSRSPTEMAEPLNTARSPGSKLQLQPLGSPHHPHTGRPPATPSAHTTRTQRTDMPSLAASSQTNNNYSFYNPTRPLIKSAASSIPCHPAKSTTSAGKPQENLRETSQSIDFTTSIPQDLPSDIEDHIHNPDYLLTSSKDCDDLSILPRPKKVLPQRELPWVFRYKVKRGMNTLSRIMASKPAQNIFHQSHAFT